MPAMNFADVPDADDHSLMPKRYYLAEYRHRKTTIVNGIEEWSYRMVFVDGPFKGRAVNDTIAWPSLRQAKDDDKLRMKLQRCKLVIHRFGFDVNRSYDYQPEHLEGKRAVIKLIHKDSTNVSTGETKTYNNIDFNGYEPPDVWPQRQIDNEALAAAERAAANGTAAPPSGASTPASTAARSAAPKSNATASAPATSAPVGAVQGPDLNLDDIPF